MKFTITLPFLIVFVSTAPTTNTQLETPVAFGGEGASNRPVLRETKIENEDNEKTSKPNITVTNLSSINARV